MLKYGFKHDVHIMDFASPCVSKVIYNQVSIQFVPEVLELDCDFITFQYEYIIFYTILWDSLKKH